MTELNKAGYDQGDMSPHVESYEHEDSEFAGEQGTTLTYMSRQDAHRKAAVSKIKGQSYEGRYS